MEYTAFSWLTVLLSSSLRLKGKTIPGFETLRLGQVTEPFSSPMTPNATNLLNECPPCVLAGPMARDILVSTASLTFDILCNYVGMSTSL